MDPGAAAGGGGAAYTACMSNVSWGHVEPDARHTPQISVLVQMMNYARMTPYRMASPLRRRLTPAGAEAAR